MFPIPEAEAALVREVYRLYVEEELGSRRVAHRLNEAGHRTRSGTLWTAQFVQKLVRDPKYAGWVTFDEVAYEAKVESSLPVHEQVRYEGKHEAIVDRDLWDKAQEHRQEGRAARGPPTGRVYALRGVVRCCFGHPAKARYGGRSTDVAWYTCRKRALSGNDPELGGCDAPAVRTEVAEDAVREVLTQLLADPAHLHEYLVAAQRQAAREGGRPDVRLRQVRQDIANLEAARERYLRTVEGEGVADAQVQVALERVVELKPRIQALRDEAALLERPVVQMPKLVTRAQVEAFVASLKTFLAADGSQLAQLVQLLGREHGLQVDLLDDRQIRVSLAVDPVALGTTGPRVVATANLRVDLKATTRVPGMTSDEWVAQMNAEGKAPLCACGCGRRVEIRKVHRSKGVPSHIQGHHRMSMSEFVGQANAEGLLTISQAAAELGVSENTLRRAEDRGWAMAERRPWGARQPMRLFRRDDLSTVSAALAAAGFRARPSRP